MRAVFWKTSNGGTNWGTQEPDTSIYFDSPRSIDFINAKTGFAFQGSGGFRTNNCGGNIIISVVNNFMHSLFEQVQVYINNTPVEKKSN